MTQLYRKCLVSLRKQELKRLRKDISEEEYRALGPAIALLCHRKELMSAQEKEIVAPLFKQSPLLKVAYQFCCELMGIYNSAIDPIVAHEKITQWIQSVERNRLVCFNRFLKTLKKYRTEIENYFINRESSGFVEDINNKAKVLKRRCYGIFNLKHFFQRLFLDFSGYALFSKNQKSCYV